MRLSGIARLVGARGAVAGSDPEVKGLAEDSRKVRRGDLFFCVKGSRVDGSLFAVEAVRRGAVAVMVQGAPLEGVPVPQLVVKEMGKALAATAHAFYGDPSRRLKVVAVTGTKGKTTVTYLLRSILKAAGRKAGLIGTITYETGRKVYEAPNTTPSALTVARLMREMVDAGCGWCVMEVSSHALEMDRVRSVRFAGAVFTNLGREHLDYHRTLAGYFAAKRRLFLEYEGMRVRAVNADDACGRRLLSTLRRRRPRGVLLSYGLERPCDRRAEAVWVAPDMLRFRLCGVEFRAPLTGVFNVYNALAAVTVLRGLGIPWGALRLGLERAQAVPGRFEAVRAGQDFTVLVDYAHAPNALEEALKTARELAGESRLISVFGCGGDRDRTKRPVMGRVSANRADVTVVTSDNPRTEDPESIIREIVKGIPHRRLNGKLPPGGVRGVFVQADRARAIRSALGLARTGDVVIIAGKGHENYQITGNVKRHFDDREEALKVLKTLKKSEPRRRGDSEGRSDRRTKPVNPPW